MRSIIFLCLSLFIIFSGCKKNKDKQSVIEINPEFATYISAYTSGLVSKVAPVKIVIQKDYPFTTDENGLIQENILTFSPTIKGKTYLEDKNTLKFIPEETLPQDQTFTGNLDIGKIYKNVPDSLSEFRFQFQVRKQDFSSEILGLQSVGSDKYNLNGKIVTGDVAASQDVEKILTARLGNKPLNIKWQHAQNQLEHKYTVTDIPVNNKEGEVKLNWNGKPLGTDRKEEQLFTIPAAGEFSVTQIRSESFPEQYISVNFSQPLASSQFLDGLVEIEKISGDSDFDYDEEPNYVKNIIIDGNELKVYTTKKIGGDYRVKIFPGIKSIGGQAIASEFTEEIKLQHLYPEVKFVGNGNIVPKTDGLYLPFESVGLSKVRVEITKIYENNIHQFFQQNQYNTSDNLRMVGKKVLTKVISLQQQKDFNISESSVYQLELSKFIDPEPGAIYNVEFSFDKEFANFPCDSVTGRNDLTPLEPQPDSYLTDTSWSGDDHYYDDYYYPDDYDWRERNNPCHNSYYTNERKVSRNVLATDLGVIAKIGNDRKANITVTNLITTDTESGVDITAYDLQNQEVGKGKTDSDGFAEFALSRKPFLIKAEKGKNRTYVRVDDGSSLSLSNFAVDGQTMESGMAGFVYGERGVWRPGDSIHLTFVLNREMISIPDGQPAVLELKNPEGQIMTRKVNDSPVNGFYTFGLQTYPGSRTGNWNAEITLGGLKFFKTLKVETIKPNRLKINTTFPSELLSKSASGQYQLQSNWLTGASAGNLAAKVDATVSAIPTRFESFPNYIFDDPSREFSAEEQTIFDGSLDSEGKANITTNISTEILPPGMLKLGLFTKVFEPGGEFSSAYETKNYSPYSTYVGLNMPVKENDYFRMLETGKSHQIPLATVDMNGKPLSKENIEVKVYKIENSWWYNAGDQDLAYFVSGEYENLFDEQTVSTQNGRGTYELRVPEDEWGNYFIRVCDTESGHCSGEKIWVDWADWRSRGNVPMEGASLLNFAADKEKYEVGDVAKITIPSSMQGKALVSIENGMKILQKSWHKTQDGSTTFNLKITEEMAPNCYVNISLIQPHAQTVNDMPIRMYGVIPLVVENKARKLNPVITSPAEIKSNAVYEVKVSEAAKKPMTYTLAVVDEGLLDITNFKTPDIFGHFNQKQSLGVKSWDIYNYVLGAYGGRIESIFTIGGDMSMQAQNKEKISRFEPVVEFLGPFELAKGERNTHKLKMDNYVGSVKIMVVAGNDEAFGSAEKSMPVRQPLMTLTTLPRVLNPGDVVEMPVTVIAMDKKIKNVNVAVSNNDLLQLNDQGNKSLTFTKTGDQVVNFSFKVPQKTGKAKVQVKVGGHGESASQAIELEVRSPNPPITRTSGAEVTTASPYTTSYQPFGMAGTNLIQLQLSSLPEMRLQERLNFLTRYPHGCIEQVTSSAFPQLFLADLMDLSSDKKSQIERNVKSALNKIKNNQLSGGGIGYWPGASRADDWGSSYALHFVLKAEEKGYEIPVGLKSGLIDFQKKEARHWNYYNDNLFYAKQQQAYRLYTLALAGKPDLSLMNRLKESSLEAASKWHLTAAYQLAGQGQNAAGLIQNTPTNVEEYQFNPETYGSSLRDQAIILSALTVTNQREKAGNLLRIIAAQLSRDSWYSTQTTAFALMAINEYIKDGNAGAGIDAQLVINGQTKSIKTAKSVTTLELPVNGANFTVKNLKKGYLHASVINTGSPMGLVKDKEERNLTIAVSYTDANGNPVNVSDLKQGTDFRAVATITNPGMMGMYNELALMQMFPSGWEIINTRVNDQVTTFENSGLDFQDFRDDRVYSYFDLMAGKSITVTTLLNASYAGEFDLPAAYCEAMYNHEIYALEPGRRVKVSR